MADGKCTVAALPLERGFVGERFMNPYRRTGFKMANQIGDRDCTAERDQNMHMIGHAASVKQDTIVFARHAAEVFVKTVDPGRLYPRFAVFGAENDVEIDVG
jgi:hypothetical protein